ncbi:uncharacterized protein LOC120780944 [Bactrocera tryoni]|uniref:uncharacterized protein LOC120780944 n=1 Tax=Bactrocera tryoni TaxID=59916 RepID=UPI001A976F95|nr:uncharacterized protein LOC120780944 [Bactrocera tryoni]
MDKFNIEMLISEVQSYPVLWQDSHKDFKNKNITDNIWKKLGEICGCSGEAAKGKWKNLRDTYRRNLQKSQPAKSGSEAPKRCSGSYGWESLGTRAISMLQS